jgi:hypothetical protein
MCKFLGHPHDELLDALQQQGPVLQLISVCAKLAPNMPIIRWKSDYYKYGYHCRFTDDQQPETPLKCKTELFQRPGLAPCRPPYV